MTGRTSKMIAMNERHTEREHSALDRIEGVCLRLASSTNVDALRRGLADIHVLVASKPR
jgi:Na+-translocating ferredoxin:NAD+ oxidoreductase RnfE subunit